MADTALVTWLQENGLSSYVDKFTDEGYDMELIRKVGLTEKDLDLLGVTKLGHRKKFFSAVQALHPGVESSVVSTNSLLKACSNQLAECLDSASCWDFLSLCEETDNVPFTNLVWKYIRLNAKDVIFSSQFQLIPESRLLAFLDAEDIQVSEQDLINGVTAWLSQHPKANVDEIASLIRFGSLNKAQLQAAEKLPWVTKDMLYNAWRSMVLPDDKSNCGAPRNYFRERMPKVMDSLSNANNVPYEVTVSSVYAGFSQPTYDCLTNEEYNLPGVGTNYEPSAWVQASYSHPVTANKLVVGAPNGGIYTSQGWNSTYYVDGLKLQASDNGSDWTTILTLSGCSSTGPSSFSFEQQRHQYWRLQKDNAYVATGTFILTVE